LTEHRGIASVACPHVALSGLYQSAVIHSFILPLGNEACKVTYRVRAPLTKTPLEVFDVSDIECDDLDIDINPDLSLSIPPILY
jgi:hypothetical protein